MGQRGLTHPGAIFPRLGSVPNTITCHRRVPFDNTPEFAPVDRPVIIPTLVGIPLQIGIRHLQAKILGLRHSRVDELLAQFIIAEPLDLSCHALVGMFAIAVMGTEHHDGWPPPTVQTVLRHLFLLGRALRQCHDNLISLTLVKRFLFANADHCACIGAERTPAQRDLIMMAAPSTTQPTGPISAQDSVG